MKILSVRENPEIKDTVVKYFQKAWPSVLPIIYEDCIAHCIGAKNPLPQWYLLKKGNEIIGCAGLITNDFISRSDLYPWICAIYIEEKHRGNAYASLLIDKAKSTALAAGFEHVYLCTEHVGYYEKYGFEYIGQGYHPWGEESRIYGIKLQ
ncbi:GNAT family N-acetyltransferase [Flagellimonas sp. S3867]|uniref:GNAT family N-acetyltransferase n=1 Tax=Flagellimonas sp. S3867 TaxID=2768063 RepID=UPI0016822454|nr:GNAT family N-acetyltransferase [Flagellimonas sp. S3867]